MASLKDFSFYAPDFIPNSVYMSEEESVEMQTWMYMQDVSYQLPIVCPSLFPWCSAKMSEARGESVVLGDCGDRV